MEHICSNCGNVAMQRSTRRGLPDTLWSLLGYFPWRCHRCTKRERVRDAGPSEPVRRKRSSRQDAQRS